MTATAAVTEPMTDIEASLSDEDRAVLALAHRFAAEVLRPAGTALDRLADPAEVIAPDSLLWEVFAKYRATGLREARIGGTAGEGDPRSRALLSAMVAEEMAWGDVGLAISCGLGGFHVPWVRMTGNAELIERYCDTDDLVIGCWAITEPDHGSDTLSFTEGHFRDPSIRPNCVARPDGDDWLISGQKAAWVSNGSIAHVAVLFCTADTGRGFEGGGVFVVPLDLPGVHRPPPLNKLGQRALNQGEIHFDDVRVPGHHLVVGPDAYALALEGLLAGANAAMGQLFVGVARSGYEMALGYARERVQGGKPIIEHQSVKARLFSMFSRVEAARSLARRVAVWNATGQPMVQYSIASKVFVTRTAFEVASDALQIFGGNGLSREYPIEKVMRDARASMIEDGCNDLLSLVGAARL